MRTRTLSSGFVTRSVAPDQLLRAVAVERELVEHARIRVGVRDDALVHGVAVAKAA